LDLAFEELGLSMVYLHVAEFNQVARRMYEQLGFRYAPLASGDALAWAGRGFAVLRMEIGRQQWM
jgi:RimJ/RimL family protein N-acetyltransferase